jgi:hypothetical protein
MDTKKHQWEPDHEEELENLGLDADHSSDNFSVNGKYNTDNDRVTDNPDGEEDPDVEADQAENSPLDDK